jgi:hypothetical protein
LNRPFRGGLESEENQQPVNTGNLIAVGQLLVEFA